MQNSRWVSKLWRMFSGQKEDLLSAALREELSLANERYRLLTENLAAGVIIQDTCGKIVYCSPYTEVLTGYSLPEIYETQGDFLFNIVLDEDKEKYRRALSVCASGEPFQFRYRFAHKTGIEMWAETRTVPLLGENGDVISTLSITLDVTGAVRYQSQVEQKNRDLQDFAYMISHDLKAPLVTIKGMVAVLEEELRANLSADARASLEHISRAACRLETIVQGVVEYSKVNLLEGHINAVPLRPVLEEALNDLTAQRREALATFDISPELPAAVVGDSRMLYQIFSNLFGNALKYRSVERQLHVRIYPLASSRYNFTTIVVADNGIGIQKEKLETVFRPFQRGYSSSSAGGSGIGLASVRKLLEKLGGSIYVESELGKGSTFYITLRCANSQMLQVDSAQKEAGSSRS